ncbi:hypothetical protein BCR33DRAFT_715481 [Rhizoclosmatium globosum]|uniref:Uncharacterized protein n=1 Tax=Rhizoclosmatium globosum TaxID=329046 RepID=A0A1Y2CHJ2_9FUNG|nr:hypothetical protein BCR33DRAFT_715481 [Rhizoclosmatium globosum]|eukprot:ORY46377.1 hypothetical protein BCR33DRAFT_715481 [Rhizoclosmatium globosum]
MPSDAIPLGQDTDGAALYATRVPLEGGLHIGKARSDGICYVSYGGCEIQIPHHTPHEPLFVGVARTHYRGTPVGKCGPAMCALNYAYGGEEHQEHQYSVLVYATPVGGPGVSMNYW